MRECVFFSFSLCFCSMPKLVLFGQRQCWWHKQVFLCLSVSVKEMHIRYSFTKERRSEKKNRRKKQKKTNSCLALQRPKSKHISSAYASYFFSAFFSKYFFSCYLCRLSVFVYQTFLHLLLFFVICFSRRRRCSTKKGAKKCIKTLHRILLSWAASKNFYGVPFIVYCCYFCVVGVQEIHS